MYHCNYLCTADTLWQLLHVRHPCIYQTDTVYPLESPISFHNSNYSNDLSTAIGYNQGNTRPFTNLELETNGAPIHTEAKARSYTLSYLFKMLVFFGRVSVIKSHYQFPIV